QATDKETSDDDNGKYRIVEEDDDENRDGNEKEVTPQVPNTIVAKPDSDAFITQTEDDNDNDNDNSVEIKQMIQIRTKECLVSDDGGTEVIGALPGMETAFDENSQSKKHYSGLPCLANPRNPKSKSEKRSEITTEEQLVLLLQSLSVEELKERFDRHCPPQSQMLSDVALDCFLKQLLTEALAKPFLLPCS
ncbi:hypothetical protein RFI_28156, partial [Reticulomyxa filosa]